MPLATAPFPRFVVLAVSLSCVLLGAGGEARAQGAVSAEAPGDGVIVARQPCQFPRRTHAQFVAFMREGEPALDEEIFRRVLFEGGDHLLNEHAAETQRLVGDWLDRYVRDRAPFPPLEPHGR